MALPRDLDRLIRALLGIIKLGTKMPHRNLHFLSENKGNAEEGILKKVFC